MNAVRLEANGKDGFRVCIILGSESTALNTWQRSQPLCSKLQLTAYSSAEEQSRELQRRERGTRLVFRRT